MPSNRKRIAKLEQRLADLERALAAPRDWATMPPAHRRTARHGRVRHGRLRGLARGVPVTKPHHADPRYRRMAAAVRAAAYRDPTTKCWRCGLTLHQIRRTHPRATWDAGHLVDADLTAGLRAECSRCNRSSGAKAGNAKRASGYQW